jgi:hypothetical protein
LTRLFDSDAGEEEESLEEEETGGKEENCREDAEVDHLQ